MNDGKPYVPPPPEADGNYRYYLLDHARPVRIEYDERQRPHRAEAPDPADGGVLKVDLRLITDVSGNGRVDDINKKKFVELYRRAASEAPR